MLKDNTGAGPEDNDEEDDQEESGDESTGALWTVFRFLKPYYTGHVSKLALLAVCVLTETGYNVAFPLSLKYLIDVALLKEDEKALISILIVLGVLAFTVSAVTVLLDYLISILGAAVVRDIRARLYAHLHTLSLSFFTRAQGGEAVSRFSTDLAEVEKTVTGWISMGLMPAVELLTAIALLFYLNWPLALAAMLIWPLTLIGPRILSPLATSAAYEKKRQEAAALSIVQESVAAQPLIRAYDLPVESQRWFRQRNLSLARISVRVNFLTAMVERSVNTAVVLLHLLILGFGAWLAFHKHISIGTLVTFESVFWELSYNIGYVSQFFPEVIEAAGAIRHIHELLDEEQEPPDDPDAIVLPRIEGEIAFDNVSFGYHHEQPQLVNLTFRIPCASRVAIVGPSGSGKSTVLGLILRLYDPGVGSVRVDGHDLRKVTKASLRAQIGFVFQESFLFNATIRENIRLGKLGATDQEVEAAAKVAEIHDFISHLPQGYDTNAGERGAMMSGGERQRIALARAIVRNPAILILDEATSALDHGTEMAILATLRKLASGRTVILVTHRLSTVANFDTVLLLNRGRLAEEGKPQEMLGRLNYLPDLNPRAI